VATDIASHTQVLNDRSCVMVRPNAAGLAVGIQSLLDDGPIRRRAVEGARALQAEYGIERYVRGVARAYAFVGGGTVDETTVVQAAERIREGSPSTASVSPLTSLGATA
jgi:hypothetical protein